jgi:hypothetical protein
MRAPSSDGTQRSAGTVLYRTIGHHVQGRSNCACGTTGPRDPQAYNSQVLMMASRIEYPEDYSSSHCRLWAVHIRPEPGELSGPALLAYCSIFLFLFEFTTPVRGLPSLIPGRCRYVLIIHRSILRPARVLKEYRGSRSLLFFLEMVVLFINVVHDDRLQVHISFQKFTHAEGQMVSQRSPRASLRTVYMGAK